MTFECNGQKYFLAFSREHRNMSIVRNGAAYTVKSKYPFTTAKLYLIPAEGTERRIVVSATVGCAPTDTFSKAAGRLMALRLLSERMDTLKLSKGLKKAMWQTYMNRPRTKSVPKQTITGETIH